MSLSPPTLRHAGALAVAVVVAALAGIALHGGSADAAGAARHTVRLTANPQGDFRFNTRRLTTQAGRVTIVMRNPAGSGLQHGIAVEGHGVDHDGRIVDPGGTSRVTVTLRKGTYEFYCPVDGHKGLGMKGKLVVR